MVFWIQMEGDIPPSGGERLSDQAGHSNAPVERFRYVRLAPQVASKPHPRALWDAARYSLEVYREHRGTASEIFDLSVDEVSARRLARASFTGIVEIGERPSGLRLHPAVQSAIERRLSGRDPDVRLGAESVKIYFQVQDGTLESRLLAAHFGYTLAMVIDGVPLVSVSRYRNFPDASSAAEGVKPE